MPNKTFPKYWSRLAGLACMLIPVGVAAWLLWPAFFGGKMLWGYDLQGLGLPMQFSARRAWVQGQWPLWIPELFQGMPGLASANTDFLYPTIFILNVCGVFLTNLYAINALLQICLAGWGTFLFCRGLGLKRPGALLAGIVFASSGTLASLLYCGHTNNLNAIPLIPWAFFFLGQALAVTLNPDPGSRKTRLQTWLWWCGAGVVLGLQLLGLGMQIFAYTMLALLAYVLWRVLVSPVLPVPAEASPAIPAAKVNRFIAMKILAGFSLMTVTGLMIGAPQWLITAQYMPYCWHARLDYPTFTGWSFPPLEALTWLVPGFFGWMDPLYRGQMSSCTNTEYFGLLPWALACAALAFQGRQKRGPVLFFALAAALSFVVAVGKWTPLHLLFYHLPVFKGFRAWNRFLCLLTFSVSVLAGFGFQALEQAGRRLRVKLAPLAFCALAALAGTACYFHSAASAASLPPLMIARFASAETVVPALTRLLQVSSVNCLESALALAALFLLWWWWGRQLPAAAALAILLVFHFSDLGEMHRRFVVFKNPQEVVVVENYARYLPDPLRDEPYRVYEQDRLWDYNEQMYGGYENVRGYHGLGMMPNFRLEKAMANRPREFLDFAGARYFISRKAQDLEGLRYVAGGPEQVYVYENTRAYHRAYLVYKSLLEPTDAAIYERVWNKAVDPAQEVALTSGQALDNRPSEGDSVVWISRRSQDFKLKVTNASPAYLVVTQTWYPGWQALVDGTPVEVQKAYGAFQTLLLPAGIHEVEFRFTSAMFFLGLCLAGLGLALCLALAAAFLLARRLPDGGKEAA